MSKISTRIPNPCSELIVRSYICFRILTVTPNTAGLNLLRRPPKGTVPGDLRAELGIDRGVPKAGTHAQGNAQKTGHSMSLNTRQMRGDNASARCHLPAKFANRLLNTVEDQGRQLT